MDPRDDHLPEHKRKNKGIGFVTFETEQAATDAVNQGTISFDVYNMDVERAFDRRRPQRTFDPVFETMRRGGARK